MRRDPKPDFNFLGYSKEGIEIRLRYFFDGDDPWWDAQNEVIMAIWGAMRKHRLRIAIHRHLLGSGDEWGELDQRKKTDFGIDQVLEQLMASDIFCGCAKDTLLELAASASVLSLNPQGCFYEPDDASDGLYLILEGNVSLYKPLQEDACHEVKVENCTRGAVFGVQSFIVKEPRTGSVAQIA